MIDILVFAGDIKGGIPHVITEAMSMNTAVISSNLGAIFELIHDKINGYMIDQPDAGKIEEKLRILLSSPDLLKKIKNHALNSVKKFDRNIWLKKLEESFQEIWSAGFM